MLNFQSLNIQTSIFKLCFFSYKSVGRAVDIFAFVLIKTFITYYYVAERQNFQRFKKRGAAGQFHHSFVIIKNF